MSLGRQSFVEGVRALVVIALLFLSFGHKPVEISVAYDHQLVAHVLDSGTVQPGCGDPADHSDHAPCHACRVFAGLDLPPAPCSPAPAFARVLSLAYAAMPAPVEVPITISTARPRGPPRA